MKKAIVVGSGISGLSLGQMLFKTHNIKILERANNIGGLIKCERVNGSLFHRVGGHVFNSKNENVLNWFWDRFDREREFLAAKRNAKIFFQDRLVGYPIENFLYQLPKEKAKAIVAELMKINRSGNQEAEAFDNFEDFLKCNFGDTLYSLYFGPYNKKIWNTDLKSVPISWLEGKLPMPEIEEVITSNIVRKEEDGMVHSSFYYPKRDGSQFIIDRLAEGLDITTSYDVLAVDISEKMLSINKDLKADILIYTGDVRKLSSIIKIADPDLHGALDAVTDLPANGTSNIFCETNDNDLSWLYIPEARFKAHRIIYTGNFSSTNNEGTRRKTCVVEFSGKHNLQEMKDELQLLPGNLKPIAFNYEPNSYIIQHKDTREKIAVLKEKLAKYNIYLLGRFAEWEYYNMDKCIEGAMQLKRFLTRD